MYKRLIVQCKKCGFEFQTSENRVRDGRGKFCSKSCSISFNGKKHGHATSGLSKTYTTWAAMLQRCNNPKNSKFSSYGGRGIYVCERWIVFENFLEDMGERPDGKTIDRINGSAGYFKENCRWASPIEQQSNLKSNVIIEYLGEKFTLAQLARKLDLHPLTLKYRVKNGWDQNDWSRSTKK